MTIRKLDRDWLTSREVQDALGLPRQRVHDLAVEGKISRQKFGVTWLYDAESVEREKEAREGAA